MSQRTRAGKSNGRNTSSKTKKLSNPIGRLTTRSNVQKKNSPSKRALEPSSPAITRRQKRLSGLTAATLLQYCTNILSPSPSNDNNAKSNKRTQRSANPSPSRRRTTKKIKVNSIDTVSYLKLNYFYHENFSETQVNNQFHKSLWYLFVPDVKRVHGLQR